MSRMSNMKQDEELEESRPLLDRGDKLDEGSKNFYTNYTLGCVMVCLGLTLYALSYVLVRILSRSYHFIAIVFFRSLIQLVLTWIYFIGLSIQSGDCSPLINGIPNKNSQNAILYRSFIFPIYSSCFYYGLQTIPIGTAAVLHDMSPIFSIIFSTCLFRTLPSVYHCLACTCALGGLILIVKPPLLHLSHNNTYNPIGYVTCLSSAVMLGLVYVLVAKSRGTDPMMFVFGMSCSGLVFSLVVALILKVSLQVITIVDWLLIVALGAIGIVANYFLTIGMQAVPGNISSLVSLFQTVVVFVFQVAFFQQIPSASTVVGAAIVVGAVVFGVEMGREKQARVDESDEIDE